MVKLTTDEENKILSTLKLDTLTPSPDAIPTEDQLTALRILIDRWYTSSGIFVEWFLPKERADKMIAEIEEEKRQADLLANPPLENERIQE